MPCWHSQFAAEGGADQGCRNGLTSRPSVAITLPKGIGDACVITRTRVRQLARVSINLQSGETINQTIRNFTQ